MDLQHLQQQAREAVKLLDAPAPVAPPAPAIVVEAPARTPVGWSIVFARDSDGNISGATVLPMEPSL